MTRTEAGALIREARSRKGLNQKQLAALTHLDQGYLSRVERGERPLTVHVATLAELALELERDVLVRWAEDLPANLRSRFGAIPGYVNRLTCTLRDRIARFPRRSVTGPRLLGSPVGA